MRILCGCPNIVKVKIARNLVWVTFFCRHMFDENCFSLSNFIPPFSWKKGLNMEQNCPPSQVFGQRSNIHLIGVVVWNGFGSWPWIWRRLLDPHLSLAVVRKWYKGQKRLFMSFDLFRPVLWSLEPLGIFSLAHLDKKGQNLKQHRFQRAGTKIFCRKKKLFEKRNHFWIQMSSCGGKWTKRSLRDKGGGKYSYNFLVITWWANEKIKATKLQTNWASKYKPRVNNYRMIPAAASNQRRPRRSRPESCGLWWTAIPENRQNKKWKFRFFFIKDMHYPWVLTFL